MMLKREAKGWKNEGKKGRIIIIREYNAMHEENFLSSWLRKDLIGNEKKVNERAGEEEENKRKREEEKKRDGEKEENGTVKRKCVSFNLAEDLESCGGVSWSDLLDHPDDLSDCESESRAVVSASEHQEKVMPPTPNQSSHPSTEERQWLAEVEVQESFCSARERTVIAKMESNLDTSDELRVEFRELEHFMGPEDSDVNLMYILVKASRRDSSIFEIFSTSGSDHLVASRNRWVKYQEQKSAQQERLQRRARTDFDKGGFCWTEAGERLARRMLRDEKMRKAKICSKSSGKEKMRSLLPVR